MRPLILPKEAQGRLTQNWLFTGVVGRSASGRGVCAVTLL